jgi:hypothetical protein
VITLDARTSRSRGLRAAKACNSPFEMAVELSNVAIQTPCALEDHKCQTSKTIVNAKSPSKKFK